MFQVRALRSLSSLGQLRCSRRYGRFFSSQDGSQSNGSPFGEENEDDILGHHELVGTIRKFHSPVKTGKRNLDIVHDPLYNKGTGFKDVERDRLGLRGLVPPRRLSMKTQLEKVYKGFLDEPDPLRRNVYLCELQNRNETLYFRLLIDHIEEMAPIVYTPTVGLVCQKFGSTFRRPRGMYFSSKDRGHFGAMVHNWPCDDVQIIVVTDGSRILGLGDLGINGMGIPIGKLSLYVAAGGLDPRYVLPVTLDMGTNNEKNLNDPYYFGMQHRRLEKYDFWSMMDEFMRAIRHRWPKALIQFEDFSSDHAADVLHAYRLKQLCFNDDIQGTGAVVLAGALSACKQTKTPLTEQRIVVVGAGSAGLGVATTLLQGMLHEGLSPDQAQNQFYLMDQKGLIGKTRPNLSSAHTFFARKDLSDQMSLLEVIKQVQPTMLLGLSSCSGAFTEECIREMSKHVDKPIIFPLSNPTSNAECSAVQAFQWTDGKCIFASGSPFDPVTYNGVTYHVSQCNNMFIFPGVGLASVLCEASRVTDRMLYSAAKALANCLTKEEIQRGQVFPSVGNIREVSKKVTTAVMKNALDDGVARFRPKIRKGASLEDYVASKMFNPYYVPLV